MSVYATSSMLPKSVLLMGQTVEVVDKHPLYTLQDMIDAEKEENDAFYVVDMWDITRKYNQWKLQLPRVSPFYAVKCNDDTIVLKLLAKMGLGFDCASKGEVQKIKELGVQSERIIFANPCKQASHIRFAKDMGVNMMTFDNETELHKVKAINPDAQLVVRILPPTSKKVQCELGMKFGVAPKDVPQLLKVAKELELNVVGVSFHVGSGCYDAMAYSRAVAAAHTVFDMGLVAGYSFSLLDIGGGFPGYDNAQISFEEIAHVLRSALDLYFPEGSGVTIIAEPGRYFVASAYTLATNIIAKRIIPRDRHDSTNSQQALDEDDATASNKAAFMYYVNDGVYGSFNCLLYDHATVEPIVLGQSEDTATFTSSLWGPTCDGLDCILEEYQLPKMSVGDWIIFKNMGAYTLAASSTFNGMARPKCHYINSNMAWYDYSLCGGATLVPSHLKTGHDALCAVPMPLLQEVMPWPEL